MMVRRRLIYSWREREREGVWYRVVSKMAEAMKRMINVSLLAALLSVSIGILLLFQSVQPEPYLDEVFHIPQAQKYCYNKFSEWDPKITTLPGLYLVSLALLRIMAFVSRIQVHVLCSVFWLRFTNVLFMFGNAWILRKILLSVHKREPKSEGSKVFTLYMYI